MKLIKTVCLEVHTKDHFNVQLKDFDGKVDVVTGYAPPWMPGGGGTGFQMVIDNATGRILNWQPINHHQVITESVCSCFDQDYLCNACKTDTKSQLNYSNGTTIL